MSYGYGERGFAAHASDLHFCHDVPGPGSPGQEVPMIAGGCITIGERLSVEGANGVVHCGVMKMPLFPLVGTLGSTPVVVDVPVALKVRWVLAIVTGGPRGGGGFCVLVEVLTCSAGPGA